MCFSLPWSHLDVFFSLLIKQSMLLEEKKLCVMKMTEDFVV